MLSILKRLAQEGASDERQRTAALAAALAKVNHDLRNALATATLAAPRLAKSEDPLLKRVMPRLTDGMERAVEICTEALNFAGKDAPVLVPTRFALHGLIEEAGREIGAAALNLRWSNLVDPAVEIEADREHLLGVLAELGQNAFENGATEVRIGMTTVPDHILIELADDGPGLSERARANLFTPFLGAGRTDGGGLGLVFARMIVRAHGGDLRFQDDAGGGGASFIVDLPEKIPDGAKLAV